MIIERVSCPTKKQKENISGVTSKVYKPFKKPLTDLNIPTALGPLIKDVTPEPGFLRIWPDSDEEITFVESRFGMVPRGSVLSYQQPNSAGTSVNVNSEVSVPEFTFPQLSYPAIVLDEKQQLHFESLQISEEQSKEYELQTREQSSSKDWHHLRHFRLTASNFKFVCSRRNDFEGLAKRLLKGKKVQTAAMKYGLEHEDEVAQFYANYFNRNVFKVGFIINPSVPQGL